MSLYISPHDSEIYNTDFVPPRYEGKRLYQLDSMLLIQPNQYKKEYRVIRAKLGSGHNWLELKRCGLTHLNVTPYGLIYSNEPVTERDSYTWSNVIHNVITSDRTLTHYCLYKGYGHD